MATGTMQIDGTGSDQQAQRRGTPNDLRQKHADGLHFSIAQTIDDVVDAWGLVYREYLRGGLVSPNHAHVHTVPEAVGPQTAVILGRIGPVCASTLSAYLDTPEGLPLDSVYGEELAALRDSGRRISEVGLFADRREKLVRSADSLFDLMRFAYYYCRHHGMDDIMIGVHPRHMPFYCRLIGFDMAGEERQYATVNDRPVILLRLDLRTCEQAERLPRGLKYFMNNPLPAEAFANKASLDEPAWRGTAIAAFLNRPPHE